MTAEDIVEWLHSIKQGQYAEIFQEKDIDGDILSEITINDLVDAGIKSLDSKIILNKFKKIQ